MIATETFKPLIAAQAKARKLEPQLIVVKNQVGSRDGRRSEWIVAPRKQGGAVVDFGLLHAATGLTRGQAFVACLPEVLKRHGAALE